MPITVVIAPHPAAAALLAVTVIGAARRAKGGSVYRCPPFGFAVVRLRLLGSYQLSAGHDRSVRRFFIWHLTAGIFEARTGGHR